MSNLGGGQTIVVVTRGFKSLILESTVFEETLAPGAWSEVPILHLADSIIKFSNITT